MRRIIEKPNGKSEKMIFLGLKTAVVAFVIYLTTTDLPKSPNQGKVIDRKEFQENNPDSSSIVQSPANEEIARNIEFKFAEHLVKPEPDLPWRPGVTATGINVKSNPWRRKTIEQDYEVTTDSNIPLLTIGNTIGKGILSVSITWWDMSVFKYEDEVGVYLKHLLETPFGYRLENHPPWSHTLGIPTIDCEILNKDKTLDNWVVWYHWPSVYYSYQDGQGDRWFGSWMYKETMLIGEPN